MPERRVVVDRVIRLDGTATERRCVVIGEDGKVRAVVPAGMSQGSSAAPVLDRAGCTALPLLADAHVHLGISDGVTESPELHRLDVIDAQLQHYLRHGIGHVLSLGLDQPWLQEVLQRRLAEGGPGPALASAYSAGTGFGAVDGWPPELTAPERRFRPQTVEAARAQVAGLAARGVRALKIWVDDFGGTMPKIPRPVIRSIAEAARRLAITTFAHVYFRDDAADLVEAGIDVLAHSIRDVPIDAAFARTISESGATLVPTLVREETDLAFAQADNFYLDDPLYRQSAGDLIGPLRLLGSTGEPARLSRNLENAMVNLRTCVEAGVPVGLGTDSGFRTKLGGFAEHRELELMHAAGLAASDCLKAGLQTGKRLFATALTDIAAGEPASFLIVRGNPLADIRTTRNVVDVWVRGERRAPVGTTIASPS